MDAIDVKFIFFFFFFFFLEFQLMSFALNDSSLLSDQDTNRFLVEARIKSQISYSIIKIFTNRAN